MDTFGSGELKTKLNENKITKYIHINKESSEEMVD
jgi:hypothetical protein